MAYLLTIQKLKRSVSFNSDNIFKSTSFTLLRILFEVIKIIVENDDIRCAIIKFWEIFDDDIDILINSNTGEIIFYSYHCSGTPSKDWRSILFDEDFKSTIVPRFSEILKYWFETELKGISIEKIDMIS